jgi:hypothetical protein
VRVLTIIAWAGWGALLLALLVALIMASTERHHAPEVSRGMGPLVVGVLLAALLCAGALLYWFGARQWKAGVILLAILFWWPGLLMTARTVVLAYKNWRWEREAASEASLQNADPATAERGASRDD